LHGVTLIYTGLYKERLDGTDKELILDSIDFNARLNIADDWIYFIGGGRRAIQRVKTDGTGLEAIHRHGQTIHEMVVSGDWIYYVTMGDGLNRGGLHKVKIDGTGEQRLFPTNARNINVAGDWIYFIHSEISRDRDYVDGIYRIKTDGTNTELIYKSAYLEFSTFSNYYMTVYGDFIYYKSGHNIYRLNIDGTNRREFASVSRGHIETINFLDGWIYFNEVKTLSDRVLNRIHVNTSESQVLNSNVRAFSDMCIVGEWIYCRTYNGTDMYKVRTDGTGWQEIK